MLRTRFLDHLFTLTLLICGQSTQCAANTPLYVQRTLITDPAGLADIAIDSTGNVFIADGFQSVVKFDKAGLQAPLQTPIQGLSQPKALTLDKQGNIYVVTGNGVMKFDATGVAIPLSASIPSDYYSGIVIDSNGNIILTNQINVARYAPDGTLLPFTTPISGLNQSYSIALDTSDNIYVQTAAKSGSPTVLKFDPQGNPIALAHPIKEYFTMSVAVDPNGNIYTVEQAIVANNVVYHLNMYDSNGNPLPIQQIAPDPQKVRISPSDEIFVASESEIYRLNTDGSENGFAHPIACLDQPYGVALDQDGNLFVSGYGGRILKYDPSGVSLPLSHRIQGLIAPEGLAFDKHGNLYVAQYGTSPYSHGTGPSAIYKFDPTGLPAPFENAIDQLNGATGVAIDSFGNILVAQVQGNEILRFDSNGNSLPFMNRILSTSGFWGIATDSSDNIYVTEGGYDIQPHQVLKFSDSGDQINFSSPIANLNSPTGITLDASGNIFVTSWDSDDREPQNVFFQEFAGNGLPIPITINNLNIGTWGTAAINSHGFIFLPSFGVSICSGDISVMIPDEIFGNGFQ